MTNRTTPMNVGSIYHIYNRGVNKEKVYYSKQNCEYFLYKMGYHFRDKTSVLAYCLLPNHFHILIKVTLSVFIQHGIRPFFIAYTLAVNKEHNRVGPLFQGHYQSNLIDSDEYLLDCVRYIHLIPVKAGLVATPQEWDYSSYRNYLLKTENSMVLTKWIFDYFDSLQEFRLFSESENESRESLLFSDYGQ